MVAWPTVEVSVAAAMNAIKGEANTVNRRRHWDVAARRVAVRQQREPGRRSTPCRRPCARRCPTSGAWMRVKARLHADDQSMPTPQDRRRPRLVGSRGAAARSPRRHDVGRGDRRRPIGVQRVQPGARRARRPGARRALDRCAPRRRQVGRRVLHAVRRRSLARAAELVGLGRVGADDGPRTRPRLSQHDAGRSHVAAAAAPDGARRDRQHLLRDAGRRGRPRPPRGHRSPGAARHRPPGHEPGRRRHPLPVPVRDRGLRPTPAAHAQRRPSCAR